MYCAIYIYPKLNCSLIINISSNISNIRNDNPILLDFLLEVKIFKYPKLFLVLLNQLYPNGLEWESMFLIKVPKDPEILKVSMAIETLL